MSDLPSFKNFVSEDEIAEQKQKRQEEWEKVRKPDEPLEAPEEENDPRSLYDRLQEQKDKKQQDYEDQFKLKNQVKGLGSDEAEFLDFVSNKQQEIASAREQENEVVLAEYRSAMMSQTVSKAESSEKKTKSAPAPTPSSSKKSQMVLLAGAVKRKGPETGKQNELKKSKSDSCTDVAETTSDNHSNSLPPADADSTPTATATNAINRGARVIGILPGLGQYSGTSSESDSSSSEDSDIDTSFFVKKVVYVDDNQ